MLARARLCVISGVVLVCAGALTGAPSSALAHPLRADPPGRFRASFSVSLVPRATRAEGAWDPVHDRYADAYVNPKSWHVELVSCIFIGADGEQPTEPSPLPTPTWRLEPLDGQPAAPVTSTDTDGDCTVGPQIGALGRWRVTKTVENEQGHPQSVSQEVTFRDILVAAVGDSFAAGEGNPEHGHVPDKQFTDTQCHRSMYAWPSSVAQALENRTTAVTYLNFACSGASIRHVTDQRYGGQEPWEGPYPPGDPRARRSPPLAPQVFALRKALGSPIVSSTRTIDVLLASAGVNDVGISDVLTRCVYNPDCQHPVRFGGLAPSYQDLDLSMSANLKLGSVYFAGYPERLFTDEWDEPEACGAFSLMNDSDAAWVTGLGHTLNSVLTVSARANGWTVVPTVDPFRGHGYCATDFGPDDVGRFPPSPKPLDWRKRYFHQLRGSLLNEDDVKATVHPNVRGHDITAREVRRVVRTDVAPPRKEQLTLRFLRVRVGDLGRDPDVQGSKADPWNGQVKLGMKWYLSKCGHGAETVSGLLAHKSLPADPEVGWTDIGSRPCMSFPISTVGHAFEVHGSAKLEDIEYGDAQFGEGEEVPHPDRHYELSRVHVRSDPWVNPGPDDLNRSVYRQYVTEGYGELGIEYEITSQPVINVP